MYYESRRLSAVYLWPRDCIEQNATSDSVELEATAYPFRTTEIDFNIVVSLVSMALFFILLDLLHS